MEEFNIAKNTGSILDRVLSSQASRDRENFDPPAVIKELVNKHLPVKEADIVYLRHGLKDQKIKTLKEVGLVYNITRERVRQIEKSALNRLKIIAQNHPEIIRARVLIHQVLEDNGGAMTEKELLKEVLSMAQQEENAFLALKFILHNILDDKFQYVVESANNFAYWRTPLFSPAMIDKVVDLVKSILSVAEHPLSEEDLWKEIMSHESYNMDWSQYNPKSFFPILAISKKVRPNIFGEWGLSSWKSIIPKRMNDKIYLVLQKVGKPLHFVEIADEINKANFDKKKAYPATIHNELILNKDRYVLVGRGIYALSEWGYKPGVVADVVNEVLAKHPEGLAKDQVMSEVLKKRQVKTGTIYLALMNKNSFLKKSGRYFLVKTGGDDQTS